MREIKNNFKFSNDKDYNKEFLSELENKEEFDCVGNLCGAKVLPCGVNACVAHVIPCAFHIGVFIGLGAVIVKRMKDNKRYKNNKI